MKSGEENVYILYQYSRTYWQSSRSEQLKCSVSFSKNINMNMNWVRSVFDPVYWLDPCRTDAIGSSVVVTMIFTSWLCFQIICSALFIFHAAVCFTQGRLGNKNFSL